MIRRKGRRQLSPRPSEEDNINPMDGLGNMSDVMLVLAVGMMLAVVTNWNVDLSQSGELKALENAQTLSEDQVIEVESNEALQELGTVYQDPETGEIYVRVDE